MGICFSVQKNPRDSAVKPRLSNDEKQSVPSPVKGKINTVNGGHHTVADIVLNSQQSSGRFTPAGSKDESFYDSQPWLESDAEDDYFSVRGDFTPSQSRGSTPVHNSSFLLEYQHTKRSPHHVQTTVISPTPVPAPPSEEKKMRLLELFKESLPDGGETEVYNKNDPAPVEVEDSVGSLVWESKSVNGSSFSNSGSIDARGQAQVLKEDDSLKSAQCCLPGFSSRSSSERRKRQALRGTRTVAD